MKGLKMSNLDIRTLLVVDDEVMMLEILSELLVPMGINIVQAISAEQAFSILEETKVTAILSDIRMPGFSGFEFLEKLRSTGNNIPLVFLTASGEKDKLHRALQLGAVDFIDKPFNTDHLKEVVFKLLEIGTRQIEIDKINQETVVVKEGNVIPLNVEGVLTKKNRLISLLRINLPWQKAK